MKNIPTLTGDAHIKTFIYINYQFPSFSIAPIPTNSPLIAGVTLASPLTQQPLHLISAYLQPGWAQDMAQLQTILSNLRPNPTLVGMDSNFHHTMWSSQTYTHTNWESEDLIPIMNNTGLLLWWEFGVPKFKSNRVWAGQTTFDLQWVLLDYYNLAATTTPPFTNT